MSVCLQVCRACLCVRPNMPLVHDANEIELVGMLHGLAWNFDQNDVKMLVFDISSISDKSE